MVYIELYNDTDSSEGVCVIIINWSAVWSETMKKYVFSSPVVNTILLYILNNQRLYLLIKYTY